MSKTAEGTAMDGSLSLWHPWQDKPGYKHPLAVWDSRLHTISTLEATNLFQVSNVDEMFNSLGKHRLMTFCDDVLDETCIPFTEDLLGHKQVHPYLAKSGRIATLRLSQKRGCGFLTPASTFAWHKVPTQRLIENVHLLFHLFGFEAPTLPSLSEKVLRSTLPEKLFISRPSAGLRKDILYNHRGGRIDRAATSGVLYDFARMFDENKAYLHHSRQVPSPFKVPVIWYKPMLENVFDHVTGWWNCRLVACDTGRIPPLQLNGEYPVPGEVVDVWLWTEELTRCLDYGYQLIDIAFGYGFREMSNFLEHWSDILWEKWLQAQGDDPHVQKMIKCMMVGLPGRFLRQPEIYELKHRSEAKPGDVPIQFNWKDGSSKIFSEYVVHPVYDHECTALSPVGSYIVSQMRCELYDKMKEFEDNGYHIIRAYVDSIAVSGSGDVSNIVSIGSLPGQWKETRYINAYAEENRFIGKNTDPYAWPEDEMKAPGFSRERRILFWRKYRRLTNASP